MQTERKPQQTHKQTTILNLDQMKCDTHSTANEGESQRDLWNQSELAPCPCPWKEVTAAVVVRARVCDCDCQYFSQRKFGIWYHWNDNYTYDNHKINERNLLKIMDVRWNILLYDAQTHAEPPFASHHFHSRTTHQPTFNVSIINNSTFSSFRLLMDILPFIRKVALSISSTNCVPFCPFSWWWCECVYDRYARVWVRINVIVCINGAPCLSWMGHLVHWAIFTEHKWFIFGLEIYLCECVCVGGIFPI